VHLVHHEPRTEGTDQHEVLLAAADVLPERHLARVAHRLGEETVGLLAALVGAEVVDVLEVDGVDPLEGHELVDVDGRAGRRLDRPELGVGEGDVALALELVALDQLVPLDDALAAGAVELLADARAALLVQQVEGRLLRLRGDVETDFRLRPAERTLDAAEVELERRGHARSKIVAMPCPKPMHMVASPKRPWRRLSSCRSVAARRAPLHPSGWPSATAPPLTLSFSSGISR